MTQLQRVWNMLAAEPCTWIFYCFFQPTRFRKEWEIQDVRKRVLPMLRLILPMVLISFALSVALALLVHFLLREQGLYHTHALLLAEQPNYITSFLTVTMLAIPIIVMLVFIDGWSYGCSYGVI